MIWTSLKLMGPIKESWRKTLGLADGRTGDLCMYVDLGMSSK